MSASWTAILNELNRDVAREQPTDVIQWAADWFHNKLRQEASCRRVFSGPDARREPLDSITFNNAGPGDRQPHSMSPYSEMGPTDSPFGGPAARRATAPTGSNFSAAPIFSAPFASGDRSPFGTERGETQFNTSPFGKVAQSTEYDDPPVPTYALGRRTSVSAESLAPSNQRVFTSTAGLEATMEEDSSSPNATSVTDATPVFPKTDEQLARIRRAFKPNFLFRNLDEEQEADVLAAMKEVTIGPNEVIIEQGAAGDYFYVVESGKLDVYIKKEGQVIDTKKGDKPHLGKKVAECSEGSSFGELALMHNSPRAASILSLTPCTLWALDRVSFRIILLDHTSRKRRLYESFLSEVPILASLQPQERAKIADVLESRTYTEGQDVIKQGDAGDEFFLIESGNAVAIKTDADGTETIVKRLEQGEYFGELALLNRRTRAATIRAEGPQKLRVAALGEQAFTRLLGPVRDIMARSVSERYGFSSGKGSI
nr:cAMP-dependent protein kinase regulator [Cryptococcus depauperatus CBS 7855]